MTLNTGEMEKGATKHCSWGIYKSDSGYQKRMPVGIHFIRFAKVGNVDNGMTELEKNKQKVFTEKGKNGCMHVVEKVLQSIDKKKMKRPLERNLFLAKKKKVRANRTKKHSESEICLLNSTVQSDKTDYNERLVGDMSTLSTIPPHK